MTLRGYLAGSYWEQEVPVTLPEHRESESSELSQLTEFGFW